MKIRKIWSMSTFRLLLLVVSVVVPLNILTLVLSNTAVTEVLRQISAETENALEIYMNQIDGAMERIVRKMHLVAREDVDFSRINTKEIDGDEEYYRQMHAVVQLYNGFGDILDDHSWVTGVYVSYPEKDMTVVRCASNYMVYEHALENYLLDSMEEADWLNTWRMTELNGRTVMIVTAKYKNAWYGAWFDVKLLAEELGLSEPGRELVTLFVRDDGSVCYRNDGQAETPIKDRMDLNETVFHYDGESYMLAQASADGVPFTLVQIFSKSEIDSSLPAIIRVLQIASFAALIILPVIILGMKKWMIAPLSRLTQTMEEIEAGNMEVRIREEKTGSEFEQINHNFNHMMDEVSDLKISVYEQQLEKQQIKMRFLSQQIQPHFILNTLNILYSYEQEEYPLIQKMILCLAKYFRYIVNANSKFVLLSEEMDHIRNYFEIQQVRYPETFFAFVEYDEEIADCLVPPLLIQNFAENAIKHSLKIGNNIDIFVIGQKYGEDAVRIRMLDTGEGIDGELLEKIRRFRDTGEPQEGLGIGIQNAVERLQVLYDAKTQFEIVRDEPHGTRIEIVLPLFHAGDEPDGGEGVLRGVEV